MAIVEFHTRSVTLVVQKTVHGDDAFSPLVDAALGEFLAEGRKDVLAERLAGRPYVPMGAARGRFVASNGVTIDWIASELDPPHG